MRRIDIQGVLDLTVVMAIAKSKLGGSGFALRHELTHLIRHFKGITPLESEASMKGIYRYRAWLEETKTYWHRFFGMK